MNQSDEPSIIKVKEIMCRSDRNRVVFKVSWNKVSFFCKRLFLLSEFLLHEGRDELRFQRLELAGIYRRRGRVLRVAGIGCEFLYISTLFFFIKSVTQRRNKRPSRKLIASSVSIYLNNDLS